MVIKRCSDCGRFLGKDSFGWQKDRRCSKGGSLQSYCKRCGSNRNYLWWLDNKARCLEQSKKWHKDNPKYKNQWYVDNKEQCLRRQKQYQQTNPDKVNATKAKRRAAKKNQTSLLTEIEKKRISVIYKFSFYLGKYFVVDHIQPISKGGLHHPNNLQILTHMLNAEKHNKWPLSEEEKIKYTGFKL